MPEVAPVLMVGVDVVVVEAELASGLLVCPPCRAVLRPWGYARARVLRGVGGAEVVLRPRRARCRGCARTHVLLPDVCLLRRRDRVAVIGAALLARLAGLGCRRIAVRLGVPADTVRGWLRRFAARAQAIRAHFLRWAFALDPELGPVVPAGGAFADALGAIGVAAGAWIARLGGRPLWPLVSALSGGVLLATPAALYPAVP